MLRSNYFLIAGLLFATPIYPASDLSTLNVFPNPVRVYQGHTQITFANLTNPAKIVITDINGRVVRETVVDGGSFQFLWDLTNDFGEKVASGVYNYAVGNDRGETRRGKVAVIR